MEQLNTDHNYCLFGQMHRSKHQSTLIKCKYVTACMSSTTVTTLAHLVSNNNYDNHNKDDDNDTNNNNNLIQKELTAGNVCLHLVNSTCQTTKQICSLLVKSFRVLVAFAVYLLTVSTKVLIAIMMGKNVLAYRNLLICLVKK